MRIVIRAHGRMGRSPERDLTDDYLRRAQGLARGVGLLGVEEQQVEARGHSDRTTQTRALLDGLPDGCVTVILDERGQNLTSVEMSRRIAGWRDDGVGTLVLVVGPADGFDPDLLPKGPRWSLGSQTWPHKLLRVMLAEQVFRSLSILAGTPYHRP